MHGSPCKFDAIGTVRGIGPHGSFGRIIILVVVVVVVVVVVDSSSLYLILLLKLFCNGHQAS